VERCKIRGIAVSTALVQDLVEGVSMVRSANHVIPALAIERSRKLDAEFERASVT